MPHCMDAARSALKSSAGSALTAVAESIAASTAAILAFVRLFLARGCLTPLAATGKGSGSMDVPLPACDPLSTAASGSGLTCTPLCAASGLLAFALLCLDFGLVLAIAVASPWGSTNAPFSAGRPLSASGSVLIPVTASIGLAAVSVCFILLLPAISSAA